MSRLCGAIAMCLACACCSMSAAEGPTLQIFEGRLVGAHFANFARKAEGPTLFLQFAVTAGYAYLWVGDPWTTTTTNANTGIVVDPATITRENYDQILHKAVPSEIQMGDPCLVTVEWIEANRRVIELLPATDENRTAWLERHADYLLKHHIKMVDTIIEVHESEISAYRKTIHRFELQLQEPQVANDPVQREPIEAALRDTKARLAEGSKYTPDRLANEKKQIDAVLSANLLESFSEQFMQLRAKLSEFEQHITPAPQKPEPTTKPGEAKPE